MGVQPYFDKEPEPLLWAGSPATCQNHTWHT